MSSASRREEGREEESGEMPIRVRTMMKRTAICGLTAILLWGSGFVWFLATMPARAPKDPPRADAIVVLTGGSRRVPVAVSLLQEGAAKALLVTGVNDLVSPDAFRAAMGESGLELDAQMMACCVALGYGAHDTIGNAEEAAAWVKAGDYRSMILVTSNYHMARSALEFHAAMPEIEIHEYPVLPADPGLAEWWKSSHSRLLVLSEFVKYQAAWLRLALRGLVPAEP